MYVKLADRTGIIKKAYNIASLKKYLVKNAWNPITEATEYRIVCKEKGTIILRRSELTSMVLKLHEKLGTWNIKEFIDFIGGKVALGVNVLRDKISEVRGPVIPSYLQNEDD